LRKIKNPAAEIPLPGFEIFHQVFLAERKEELNSLKAAFLDTDFEALTKMAHKWKGFSAPYGFQELAETAIKLENASIDSNSSFCSELLNEISAYLGDD
jgi:HPt (histidine-containing phosphotransfer) domain-containing protein